MLFSIINGVSDSVLIFRKFWTELVCDRLTKTVVVISVVCLSHSHKLARQSEKTLRTCQLHPATRSHRLRIQVMKVVVEVVMEVVVEVMMEVVVEVVMEVVVVMAVVIFIKVEEAH